MHFKDDLTLAKKVLGRLVHIYIYLENFISKSHLDFQKIFSSKISGYIWYVYINVQCCVVLLQVSHITEPFLDLSLPIVDSQRGQSGQRNMRGDKQTTTLTGVCELLKKQGEGMPYPVTCKRSHDGVCSIENCLSDYTDIEVMDDDNMFICSECNKRHQEQVSTVVLRIYV